MRILLIGLLLSWGAGLGGLSLCSRTDHYSAITNTGKGNIKLSLVLKSDTSVAFTSFKTNYLYDTTQYKSTNKFIQLADTAQNLDKILPIQDKHIQFDSKTNTVHLTLLPNKKMLLPTPWKHYFKSMQVRMDSCEEEMFLKGDAMFEIYLDNRFEHGFNYGDEIMNIKVGCN